MGWELAIPAVPPPAQIHHHAPGLPQQPWRRMGCGPGWVCPAPAPTVHPPCLRGPRGRSALGPSRDAQPWETPSSNQSWDPPPSDAQPPLPPEAGPLPGCPPHRSFTRHHAAPTPCSRSRGGTRGARAGAGAHLEALGVEALLAVSGHLQPRVQAPHQRLGVADVLEVAVGAEVQHLHGLGDVLHLHGAGWAKPLTTPPNEDPRAGEMWGGQAAPWRHRVRPPSLLHHGRRCHNAPPLTAQL